MKRMNLDMELRMNLDTVEVYLEDEFRHNRSLPSCLCTCCNLLKIGKGFYSLYE